MTAPSAVPDPAAPPDSSRRRSATLVVVLLSLALSLALARSMPLVDPDEGRNAEIAREMSADGDFVIPHLAGMPYLDKPPAFFWAAAAAIRAAGPTRWAPRLPSALAAALTLLALASLGRRIGGEALAWRAAALLAVAPLFAALAAYVIFDMSLALCVTIVWTLLARELADGASAGRRAAMFGAVALGLLIKGPVMLAWAVGGSAAAALLARRRAALAWLAWWPGWAIVLVTAGGWFALASARHPEYPRYAFLEESFERLTTRDFDRDQPWWFALATLIAGALPWSLVTPWSPARLGRDASGAQREPARVRRGGGAGAPRADDPRGVAARAGLAVAIGFVLFALVFFTLSRSKLVTYLVPALPPLALLAASAWSTVRGRSRLTFAAVLAVSPLLVAFGAPRLRAEAARSSGEPLARAIAARAASAGRTVADQAAGRAAAGAATAAVRYERCYSPGTDFLLARRGTLVSARADQTTSVYQARYRESLRRRGLWTVLDDVREAPPADVIVRPVPDDVPVPAGFVEIFHDRRFTAYGRMARP